MHTEAPTRREIWLAVVLLLSLLFLSRSHSKFELPVSVETGINGNQSTTNSSFPGNEIALQSLRDRIRWGKAQVPVTKIVAHVPG